jgi:hypothetical protein
MMWWTWGVSFITDIWVERNKTRHGLISLICCVLCNIYLKQAPFCISHINSIKVLKHFLAWPNWTCQHNLHNVCLEALEFVWVLRWLQWLNVDLINHLLRFVCGHFTRDFHTRILCSQLIYWPLRTPSYHPFHSNILPALMKATDQVCFFSI